MIRRHKSIFIPRVLAVLLFSLFFLPYPSALELSPETGKIEKSLYGWNGKTLFLIQEAHVDYNGQKAIIDILQSLIHQQSLRVIMVEGGWDNVGLSYLRNYASDESREKIADDFLKQGKISAEEYLDVVSSYDLLLWGIENKELYQQNLKAFLSLSQNQKNMQDSVGRLQAFLLELEQKTFSPDLYQFILQKSRYDSQQISTLEYLLYLDEKHPKALEGLKTLQQLLAFSGHDTRFERGKLEVEKRKAFNALAKKLSKLEIAELRSTLEAKTVQEEVSFYQLLLKAYQDYPKVKRPKGLKLLRDYEKVLGQIAALDARQLRIEITEAEARVAKSLAGSETDRRMLEISSGLQLLNQLFKLRYAPEDYERFSKAYPTWNFTEWGSFLKDAAEKSGLGALPADELIFVEKQIPEAKSFYDAAMKREEALVKNTVDKMKRMPDAAAAVIAGGFHTEALSKALNQEGYTVVQISPRFEPEDIDAHQKKYFDVLKTKSIL